MYIEEVILDGFKSYASRTHIKAWDPEFTAITGLNGSGKSNILDAICFVLGISNLTHVRVNNLQELIYKRGQAGISKASVTIVFNNNDTSKSPIGYEQYKQITVTRQIMVGGRNKYIVNGHNAQQQAVTNLFQSVQLNVNNPHFLIMQGKITKVLNMKPPEILAMIEEAAGTRMFEERKEKAFKTIVKKEKKLQELLTILNEEIGPKLEKLRAEKRAYLDYQKIEIEYDRMKRLIVAHQYYSNAQFIQSNENDHSNNVRLAEKLKSELDMVLKQIPSIESEIQRLTDQLNNSGSNTSKLSSKLKQLSNDIVRMQTQADIKSSTLNEENNNLSQMKLGVSEARAALEEKTNIKQNHQAEYEQIKTNYDLQFQKVQNMEDLLQSLKTGISSKEGQGTGFMDQIRVAQGEATQAATQIQQAKIKDTHLASELEKCQRNVNNALNENQATVAKRDQAKAELDKLQSNLDSLNFQPEIEKKLVETRSAMQSQLKVLQRDYNSISSKISNLDFSYSDPHPNFDRSQVRGLVAELISLDSGNSRFSTALEICAGGRLYNVVVENESVGALLLEKGRLRKKVTIIPLNKIKPYIASDQAVNTASSIAPGKVSLALTLVGYNNDVSRALEYVFGNTFICDDPSTANLVTFNDRVKTKSVTLDGDVYDPSGTLQGGSKPQSSGILIQINEMNEIKKKISHLTKEIEYTTEQINQLNQVSSSYKVLSQKIDLKKHEITLYDKQISTSSHSNIENRIKAIIEERQTLSLQTQSLETKRKAAIQEANRLETEMNDFNSNKTSKLQDMESQLSNERSTLEKVTKTYKQAEAEYTTLQLEIEQLQADLASSEAQLSEAESNFASLQSEDQEIKKNIQEYQTQYNSMKSELQQLTAARKQEDKEIKELEELKRTRVNEEADLQVKIKKVTYSIDRSQQQEQQAQKIVQQLDSEYDWISAQKDQFGQPNTQYDFSKFDIEDCTQQLQVLEERYNLLRKKINAKVMNTIDSVEKQESTLKQMLNTIKRDKNKIEDTIHSLDDYKKEALHNTWTKVSSDFGMIFSELLPGNLSKLEPPPGQTLMDGLEVRVNLGGVWKHSLTELSGGQRSLIALSLILSLLQFKPAPMYILDEIDAALDLSHTQNIGQLLRTRFKGSQFIVVSLKDGMFNNANVLFKARFKDGISVVERNSQNRPDKNKSR